MEQNNEKVQIISDRLYNDPHSRYSNVMLHIIHYPVYSGFSVETGGLEPWYGEWGYDELEQFIEENFSIQELKLVLYQLDIPIFGKTHKDMIRDLFAHVSKDKNQILSHFNSKFKCAEKTSKKWFKFRKDSNH